MSLGLSGARKARNMSIELNWDYISSQECCTLILQTINSRLSNFSTDSIINKLQLRSLRLPPIPPILTIKDVGVPLDGFLDTLGGRVQPNEVDMEPTQIDLEIRWDSQMFIDIGLEIAINYPTPSFISLPINIAIKELSINGTWIPLFRHILLHLTGTLFAVRYNDKTALSFSRDTEIGFSFDSEIGDTEKHCTD